MNCKGKWCYKNTSLLRQILKPKSPFGEKDQ